MFHIQISLKTEIITHLISRLIHSRRDIGENHHNALFLEVLLEATRLDESQIEP